MKRKFSRLIFLLPSLLLLIYSCANIGRPTGGPIDITPPKLVKSNPIQGELFFKKKKLEIEFDEIVQVEKASENVTVSPPQRVAPEIYTSGRKIFVELKDSLKSNTTYTVDFSDAIADNNEKNPFENFALSFSTGGTLDSLEISGVLLNAQDLEPMPGVYVGIHKNLADSAFRKLGFDKVTRTDIQGHFRLRNLAAGKYRIYALKDANSDFKFDPGEDIAFLDSVIVPSYTFVDKADTIWKDKVKHIQDTVKMVKAKKFLPDHLILKAFNENYKSQYLDKNERKQRNKLTITFAAPAKALPKLRPLNFPEKNWALVERNVTNDTLNYWIKDSTIYKQDTLRLEASYLYTDTLHNLSPKTDTLTFVFHDIKLAPKKDSKKKDVNKVIQPSLSVDSKMSGVMEIPGKMEFEAALPIDSINEKKFHLEEKKDSVWRPLKLPPIQYDSLAIRRFTLKYKWTPGQEYRLRIDSAAIYGINGLTNPPIEKPFKVKATEDYSGLFLKIQGINDSAFVQLLNESDKLVRQEPVVKGVAEFYYVTPGSYYLRIVMDRNNNGVWDYGNFDKKIQPEEVFYYPGKFVLRTNWDVEQEWDPKAVPLDNQKPRKLIKNKPKEREKRDAKGNVIKTTKTEEPENVVGGSGTETK